MGTRTRLSVILGLLLITGLIAFAIAVEAVTPPQIPVQSQASFGETSANSKSKTDLVQTSVSSDCLDGCPTGLPGNHTVIIHHILSLANNPDTKFADWVAYRITTETIGSKCKRIWQRDPDLPADETLAPQDYEGIRQALNADRGHQAPLASLCASPYWQEADYLSNVTPQRSSLNEGAWEHLERAERGLAYSKFTKTVFSITGPTYERFVGTLPHARIPHTVPSGYWKIISVLTSNGVDALAFYMDQDTPKNDYYCSHIVGITQLEDRTHLKFFPDMTNEQWLHTNSQNSQDELRHALHC